MNRTWIEYFHNRILSGKHDICTMLLSNEIDSAIYCEIKLLSLRISYVAFTKVTTMLSKQFDVGQNDTNWYHWSVFKRNEFLTTFCAILHRNRCTNTHRYVIHFRFLFQQNKNKQLDLALEGASIVKFGNENKKETDSMSSRKRSGSGSKRPKEKVVYIYEMIFRSDFEDPTKDNAEFWYEFFLLQPNVESLESEMTKLSCEQLITLKNNVNLLFCRCIEMLDSGLYISTII